jgi:hypothetical protein
MSTTTLSSNDTTKGSLIICSILYRIEPKSDVPFWVLFFSLGVRQRHEVELNEVKMEPEEIEANDATRMKDSYMWSWADASDLEEEFEEYNSQYIDPYGSFDYPPVEDELIEEMVCIVLYHLAHDNPSNPSNPRKMSLDHKDQLDADVLRLMLPSEDDKEVQLEIAKKFEPSDLRELVRSAMAKSPEGCVVLRSWYRNNWKRGDSIDEDYFANILLNNDK